MKCCFSENKRKGTEVQKNKTKKNLLVSLCEGQCDLCVRDMYM